MRAEYGIAKLWQRLRALIQRLFSPKAPANVLAIPATGTPAAMTAGTEVARPQVAGAVAEAARVAVAPAAVEAALPAQPPAPPPAMAAAAPAPAEVARRVPSVVVAARPVMAPAEVVTALREAQAESAAQGRASAASMQRPSALPGMSVRRYFGRLVSATPAGLTIDFTRWQVASVERFFMAITSPELIRRREAPTTGGEVLSLPNAFEGFEWD